MHRLPRHRLYPRGLHKGRKIALCLGSFNYLLLGWASDGFTVLDRLPPPLPAVAPPRRARRLRHRGRIGGEPSSGERLGGGPIRASANPVTDRQTNSFIENSIEASILSHPSLAGHQRAPRRRRL
jgi:hypothetical protein